MIALAVLVGGALGASLRYAVDRLVQTWFDAVFPWATFAVNVVGSLVLGGVFGAGPRLPGALAALLGTGFCGGLTTFSTFSFETMRLVEDGSLLEAGLNAVGGVVVGVLAAFAGYGLLHGLT